MGMQEHHKHQRLHLTKFSYKTNTIMISKVLILSCLVASGFALLAGPNCKVETDEITTQLCSLAPTKVCSVEADGVLIPQAIEPDTVCADVVDVLCVPAATEEASCSEVTRKICLPSTKVVDHPTPKLLGWYASELICRLLPKGTCEAKVTKVPKTVCEAIVLKPAPFVYFGKK